MKTRTVLSSALAGLCLTACQTPHLAIRPVGTSYVAAEMESQRQDADYSAAKAAIARRDYVTALDWLQAARARNPSDVRVLNAFGVVYDKLGRFDLSTRYYQQALEIDRGSDIVLHNLAYSKGLQARIVASPVSWELADITPPPRLTVAPDAQGTAIATVPRRSRHRLTVVNATGQPGGEQPVFKRLVALNWCLSSGHIEAGPQVETTVIRYAPAHRNQAVALARTLPGHPELILADDDEPGVRLVLGTDSRTWKLSAGSRS